jgi:hypothetical protein
MQMTIKSVTVCDENIDQYKDLVLEFGKRLTIQQQWDARTDKTKPMQGFYTVMEEEPEPKAQIVRG